MISQMHKAYSLYPMFMDGIQTDMSNMSEFELEVQQGQVMVVITWWLLCPEVKGPNQTNLTPTIGKSCRKDNFISLQHHDFNMCFYPAEKD